MQVNQAIQRELGRIILSEFEFPANTIVTVTRVQASSNLQQAKVYISVVPGERIPEVLKIIAAEIYDVQQELNKVLQIRPVPKIILAEEKETAQAQRVDDILDEIKKEEE